jgi:hypothetical protein
MFRCRGECMHSHGSTYTPISSQRSRLRLPKNQVVVASFKYKALERWGLTIKSQFLNEVEVRVMARVTALMGSGVKMVGDVKGAVEKAKNLRAFLPDNALATRPKVDQEDSPNKDPIDTSRRDAGSKWSETK